MTLLTSLLNPQNDINFQGSILAASDFPTLAYVQVGYSYNILADVTDNDPAKTNTGQSFINGDEIFWNGTDWTPYGASNGVVGMSSSVDNTLPRWNGTSGRMIQGSSIVVDDSNNMSGVVNLNATTAVLTGAALTQADVTANTGSAYTIDQANGASFNLTMNAATPTITLQTAPTSGKNQILFVRLIQDGTGGRAPTFANVTWASGTAPTVASAISAITYLTFVGAGTVWTGFASLQSSDSITLTNITSIGTISTTAVKRATRVVTAAGAVTVLASTDDIVVVNKTVGAATTVNLPAGVANQTFTIKDGKGDAASNNITLTPAAGNIDGSSTYVINANYGSATIVYNGTQWNVI